MRRPRTWRWHFIGGLQSNKAAAVAAYAAVVESVDRPSWSARWPAVRTSADRTGRRAAPGLASTRPERGGRAGADPADLADLAAAVDEAGMLELRGVMAVAPLGEDPAAAFARLAEMRRDFLAHHPAADLALGGDERRPRARGRGRRDTRARRLRGPRFEAPER